MKRQKIELKSTFNELLVKLPENQKASLLSSSSNGWQTKLAWEPCDSYQIANKQPFLADFYSFVNKHQSKGHLLIGFVNYDLSYSLHNIQQTAADDLKLPNLVFYAYNHYLEQNNSGIYVNFSEEKFLEKVRQLDKKSPAPNLYKTDLEFQTIWPKSDYKEAFRKIKDYIYDGEIYQINLTQRLAFNSKNINPRRLFAQLNKNNKTKMTSYFESDNFELISLSPERFISSDGEIIQTSPIKGTKPRGQSAAEDDEYKSNLLNDSKERAELNMITDLLRNDLGKVCIAGSVKVKANRQIARLTSVIHTYSTIEGRLRTGLSPIEALISMFPGGSVTGCPKRRAMQLIDKLEATSRSAYCGNLVVINPDGSLDSSILIRTIIKKGEKLLLPVGSGIVYDSIEQSEYQENLDKAASLADKIIKN